MPMLSLQSQDPTPGLEDACVKVMYMYSSSTELKAVQVGKTSESIINEKVSPPPTVLCLQYHFEQFLQL